MALMNREGKQREQNNSNIRDHPHLDELPITKKAPLPLKLNSVFIHKHVHLLNIVNHHQTTS